MTIEQKKIFTAFRLATGKSYDPTSKLDQKIVQRYMFILQLIGVPVTDCTFSRYKDSIFSAELEKELTMPALTFQGFEGSDKEIIFSESDMNAISQVRKYVEARPGNISMGNFLDMLSVVLYIQTYEPELAKDKEKVIQLAQEYSGIKDRFTVNLVLRTMGMLEDALTVQKIEKAIDWLDSLHVDNKHTYDVRTLRAAACYFLNCRCRDIEKFGL